MTLVGGLHLLLNRSIEALLELLKGGCFIVKVQYATIGVVAFAHNGVLWRIGWCKLSPIALLIGVAPRCSSSRKVRLCNTLPSLTRR